MDAGWILRALFATGLGALVVPGVAGAAWSGGANVTPPTIPFANSDVETDAAGNGVIGYGDFENARLLMRSVSSAGTLTPGATALTPNGELSTLADGASDADGDLAFVGLFNDEQASRSRIKVRTRDAGVLGPLTTIQTFVWNPGNPPDTPPDPPPAMNVQIVSNPNGDMVAAWEKREGSNEARVFFSKRPAGGSFGPPTSLTGRTVAQFSMDVAIADNGDAVFTWRDVAAGRTDARRLSAAGTLANRKTIANGTSGQPKVGVDASGTGFVVYENASGLRARTLSPANVTGAPIVIDNASAPVDLAINEDGDGIIAWHEFEFPGGVPSLRVKGAPIDALTSVGTVRNLSTFGAPIGSVGFVPHPAVGVDGNGNGVVAWLREESGITRVQARTISMGSALGTTATLSGAANDAGFLHLAMNDAGNAFATWTYGTDTPFFPFAARVQVSAGP